MLAVLVLAAGVPAANAFRCDSMGGFDPARNCVPSVSAITLSGGLGLIQPQLCQCDYLDGENANWSKINSAFGMTYDVISRFNAPCNGATGADSTSQIQAAIDAAAAAGGGVVTGSGVCKVTFQSNNIALVVKSGVTMLGNGGWTIAADTNSLAGPGLSAILGVGDNTTPAINVTFERMIIDGLSPTPPNSSEFGYGIGVLNGAVNTRIHGCEFKNIKGDGVNHGQVIANTGTTTRVRIIDNYFHNLLGQAVTSGNSNGLVTDIGWVIALNHLDTTTSSPAGAEAFIISRGTTNLKIVQNVITNWGSIQLESPVKATVSNNDISTISGSVGLGGIVVSEVGGVAADDITISDNRIDVSNMSCSNCNGISISGDLGSRQLIHHNTVKRSTASGTPGGIFRFGTSAAASFNDITVDHNTIFNGHSGAGATDPGDIQVSVSSSAATAARVTVDHNSCESPTNSIFVRVANGATVRGNVTKDGGIVVQDADGAVVEGNIINTTHVNVFNNASGLYLIDTDTCQVSRNQVNVNIATPFGILLRQSGANTEVACQVQGNTITLAGGGTSKHLFEQGAPNNNQYFDNVFRGAAFGATFVGAATLFRDTAGLAKATLDALTLGNGSTAYCTDCSIANPCGAGTGAWYKKIAATNICN